jgi:hypothetical protein
MQFLWESLLIELCQDCEAGILEDCSEVLGSTHDAVVVFVNEEVVGRDVLFNEDESTTFASRRVRLFQVLSRFFEEGKAVVISKVAKTPLDPNAVVLSLEFELLQTAQVEFSHFGHVELRLLQLQGSWFEQIHFFEPRQQRLLSDAAHAGATVDSGVEP